MDDPLIPDGQAASAHAGAAPAAEPYRVLARKYRPATFDDLIGQEPMVRTLANAFAAGRIPQAWMLTGVRGVGKTTTARILARALNFETEDGAGAPTVDLSAEGVHCRAIMEGRHVDVIEMDAASHTGINDIREITDAARYRPVSARYKVYIIDEVHMLSTAAFNGLLKTLEEPPSHVKFVFATTEIRKVPVTVLSRCQRFDLRRVPADLVVAHLSSIADREGVTAEPEALALIARAAEGSVRDSLSLLDQAIAHGAGAVTAADVKGMLGLADRGRVIDLFETVVAGNAAGALAAMAESHAVGAEPAVVVSDLAAFVHLVTRLKIVPGEAADATATEEEVARGRTHAEALSVSALSRLWQGLLKAIEEVERAPAPLAAAEMALVRLCHLSTLPTPEDALSRLSSGQDPPAGTGALGETGGSGGPTARGGAPPARAARGGGAVAEAPAPAAPAAPPAQAARLPRTIAEVAALASEKRAVKLKVEIERFVRPVLFEPGRIEIALADGAPPGIAGDMGARLSEWTGRRWIVTVVNAPGGRTLSEIAAEAKAAAAEGIEEHPLVRAFLDRFPSAKVVDVRVNAPEAFLEGGIEDPDAAGEIDGDEDGDGYGAAGPGAGPSATKDADEGAR